MNNARRGFTLVELLITTAIIGFLSVAGSTTYSFVRAKARDTRRVSDIRTIRNAIETYFEQNGKYPDATPAGLELGAQEAKMISDAGITPFGRQSGLIYLQNVPFNVLPYGAPYVYHAKHRDGSLCTATCPSYEVAFELETMTGELAAGPHLLTDEGIQGSEAGTSGVSVFASFAKYMPGPEQIAAAFGTAQENLLLARSVADQTGVQEVNKKILAPVSAIGALASLLAALSNALPFGSVGHSVLILFLQPVLLLFRRTRGRWGVVYDAATKVPIDLATVRLIDVKTGRAAATKVTDKDGRFAFAPRAGEYRFEIVKTGYLFPANSLAAVSDDGTFTDIYHGTLIKVSSDGEALTVNIPLDREAEPLSDARELLSQHNKRSLRRTAALLGPVLSAAALIVTPTVPMLLLFLVQIFFYQLFKRLAEPPAPQSQGVVHDLDTGRPLSGAVVRVLSLPYHKVLESRLTDARGRYGFQVGAGKYYLTASKAGYAKTETDEIDFTQNEKPAWIASDLPMRRSLDQAG